MFHQVVGFGLVLVYQLALSVKMGLYSICYSSYTCGFCLVLSFGFFANKRDLVSSQRAKFLVYNNKIMKLHSIMFESLVNNNNSNIHNNDNELERAGPGH